MESVKMQIQFQYNNLSWKRKLMIPISSQFYIPMFYYAPRPIFVHSPQFFYPPVNILQRQENKSEQNELQPYKRQTERENARDHQKSDLYVPVQGQEKYTNFMKRKAIRKKQHKNIDHTDSAERIRRKLANRPKTYQTEKKMYMNSNLVNLGIIDDQRRVLRKHRSQTSNPTIISEGSPANDRDSKCDHRLKMRIHLNEKSRKKIQKSWEKHRKQLDFYNPQADIPNLENQAFKISPFLESKKMDLLQRRFDPQNQISQ